MKRANGTGSLYKLSGTRRKPWVACITISRAEGKQQREIVGYFKTRTEAVKALEMPREMLMNQ